MYFVDITDRIRARQLAMLQGRVVSRSSKYRLLIKGFR